MSGLNTHFQQQEVKFCQTYVKLSSEPIGAGGFGRVYSAKRRFDHLPVAVKEIPNDKVVSWGQVGSLKTFFIYQSFIISLTKKCIKSNFLLKITCKIIFNYRSNMSKISISKTTKRKFNSPL